MRKHSSIRNAAPRDNAGRKGRSDSGQFRSRARPSGRLSGSAHPFLSKRVLLACLVLIAAAVIVYAPVRHFGFVWDDADYVTGNVHVAQGLTWQGAWWALTSVYASNWHPVTWLSHMLDVQLFGMNPGPQHLTNLLLHVLNALLLFGLLYRTTGALGRALFVAGLFAVHPLHVESVAWIAERKDVLSTLFGMLTVWAYLEYVRRPKLGRYLPVLALFGLGLMAKPMLVTLPFVLLLLDFWPLRRIDPDGAGQLPRMPLLHRWPSLPRLVKEKVPLFALAAIASAVTMWAQRQTVAELDRVPLSIRLVNTPVAYLAYIGKMLWPVRLAALYPLSWATTPPLQAVLGVLLSIGITACAIRAGRRHGYFLTGWLWFLGTLVPVIGLVQVGKQAMADRYTYVPIVGLFLIAAWGAPELAARLRFGTRTLPALAACLLLACTALARAEVWYWSDGTTLWQRTLEVTGDNYLAQNNLGGSLLKQGRADRAIPHFVEALRIMRASNPAPAKPDYALAQANLGMVLLSRGNFAEAAQCFAEALRVKPNFAEAHNGLGNALAAKGRADEAIGQYAEALRLRPDYAEAHNDLGMALGRQGKLDEAVRHLVEAVRLSPGFAEAHHNLGIALGGQGRLGEAVGEYEEAVRLEPGSAEAHNDLGVVLGQLGRLDEAARQFTEALRIRPDFADASSNLKLALASRNGAPQ